ncbi:cobalamin biosynthesis protein CbiM [Anoxybacter fermentans]|uniref:Cobalamin biosynthesis protein CbiM n=1 Tax=Anoxybacter fermentans TaxID=1323375 RepID=A0A3Q9HPB2_9FIRM|nr:energy-coupling factor ABC transporter permease [Anoxybacter fermentans]AZR72613.1 cobalamin biosynthesis protein CbiM [Anoxybacter fermentans]
MHIPDGFLDVKTCVSTYLAVGGSFGFGLKRMKANFKEEQIPLLGLLGAFIFAAQMINLPIAAGTSGHLLGGVLAMLVVGPWAASLIITSILIIQAIFFMDGGVAVLGANILNMAVIQVFAGYWIYWGLKKLIKSYKIRIFISAWAATVISAVAAALELAFSGTIGLHLVLPAMVGWHMLIGLIEGLITLLVVVYLKKVIPEKLDFLKCEGGECCV